MGNGTMAKEKRRWRGGLMAVAATALLLTSGGVRGVAVSSPSEAAELPEETAEAAETVALTAETTAAELDDAAAPTTEEPPAVDAWTGPVPESAPVEDEYFADTVFLGDSRTDGFRLYSGLTTGTYLCAVGATVESVFSKDVDTPQGKLPLLDALARTSCGKIYVMLGLNELGWNGTDIYRDQYIKLLERLRADHPEATVVIQSLPPVSAEQEALGSYVNNERIAAYNQVLREIAVAQNVAFLDVAEAVTGEDGCLPAEATGDGVHLNVTGCRVWLDYLRTHPVEQSA